MPRRQFEMRRRRSSRALVVKRREAGCRVLIVPVLLSFGGIEQGLSKRLDGLDYTMASQAIMPDERLVEWIRLQAGVASDTLLSCSFDAV